MLDNQEPLSIVCWLWGTKYTVEHVNKLYRGVQRNYKLPFNFYCFTDRPDDPAFDPEVQTIQIPDEHSKLRKCARRLKIFSLDMRQLLGNRICQIDVDMVIVGDITKMLSTDKDFKIYKSKSRGPYEYAYNPSLLIMDTGCRKHVWRVFDRNPKQTLKEAKNNKWTGSDKAVIGLLLNSENEAVWTTEDGIYSYRDDIKDNILPENATIVAFYDDYEMNDLDIPWMKEHWV